MLTARQRLLYAAAVLAVSLHFALAYVTDAAPFLDLQAFSAGRAVLPFQGRALTAWILNGALRLNHGVAHPALLRLPWVRQASGSGFGDPSLGSLEIGIVTVFLLAVVSMAVALLCTRSTLRLLTGNTVFASYACFLVAWMAYFNYILSPDAHFLLPYDLPSLAFFCAGLSCILARRLVLYSCVFALACLNRETAIFLILFFAVLEGTRPPDEPGLARPLLTMHLVAQVGIWLGIRLLMRGLYTHNPVESGYAFFDFKLAQNLGFLFKPQHWPTLLSSFGFLLPIILWHWRRISHRGLRRCLPILALWFAAMMAVGVIIEIRVFGELISYVALLAGLLLWSVLAPLATAGPRADSPQTAPPAE